MIDKAGRKSALHAILKESAPPQTPTSKVPKDVEEGEKPLDSITGDGNEKRNTPANEFTANKEGRRERLTSRRERRGRVYERRGRGSTKEKGSKGVHQRNSGVQSLKAMQG